MSETKILPPPAAESLQEFERLRPALEALVAAQEKARPSPPPPTETTEEALKSPVPPQGDPSAEKTGASPPPSAGQPDDSLVKAARSARDRAIDANLGRHVVDVEAVRLVLEKRGVEIGIGDDGNPAIGFKDGTESPLTYEALRAAGISDSLMRATGTRGSGMPDEVGGTVPPEDLVEKGMSSQLFFNQNRRRVLDAMAKVRGQQR